MNTILTYLGTMLSFIALDLLWLGVIAKTFYRSRLDHILTKDVDWMMAVFFYIIFIAGVLYFAVYPGAEAKSFQKVAMNGAILGLVTYATYDLVNAATITTWPKSIIVVDVVWGIALTTTVSCIGYIILQKLS